MIFLAYIAKKLLQIFGIVLLPYSIFILIKNAFFLIKETGFKKYWYEVARGFDILANKLYAPALNKHLGEGFGRDETISQRMAYNKLFKTNTKTADWWERIINFFDKNHLDKTLRQKLN